MSATTSPCSSIRNHDDLAGRRVRVRLFYFWLLGRSFYLPRAQPMKAVDVLLFFIVAFWIFALSLIF